MYLKHFGFKRLPFENTPDPIFFFMGDRYRKILALLLHGIRSRKGLMCLTGPVGSGKTMIGAALKKHLSNKCLIIELPHPDVSRVELLTFIARHLRIPVPPSDTLLLLGKIRKILVQLNSKNKYCLLIIDEAHLIKKSFFQEILILSNLATADFKLIQILLIGQHELAETLTLKEMRQFMQRLYVAETLCPMDRDHSLSYIAHRLAVGGGLIDIFLPETLDAIIQESGGLPRNINKLCDTSLLNAFVAGQLKVSCTDFQKTLRSQEKKYIRSDSELLKETNSVTWMSQLFSALTRKVKNKLL
ncbi:Type II secretory pathway, component ExeA (predicted ATPase) [Candidatus Electrothrix aarhusensis]|uniref:Type II secretory pathway, component ExeA (Predicted ATPase) n=1 Tax=Candidatus Electrothrix aarhusensis TaxID=1859131 RepID=A0A444IW74_9BACT|nr:Type II secretory pathway, component ExeA (predicted ATPase) [Candidatus Electrothrix aarhusensis]